MRRAAAGGRREVGTLCLSEANPETFDLGAAGFPNLLCLIASLPLVESQVRDTTCSPQPLFSRSN